MLASRCLFWCLFAAASTLEKPLIAQPTNSSARLAVIRLAAELAAERLPDSETAWRQTLEAQRNAASGDLRDKSFAELFGYNPPGLALQLAMVFAYLFEKEGDDRDAVIAADYLRRMADYRADCPDALRRARIEYEDGLPAVPSFFQLADYSEAWLRVRGSKAISTEVRHAVRDAIAGSADFVFVFPEWGTHNRAMLRAESLLYATLALPDHPSAARWRKMAEILAEDSLGRWEIEDAQVYHPIWLLALFRYAEAAGRDDVFRSIPVRYYLRYFTELLTPASNIPAFGDAWWNANQTRYFQVLSWGAKELGDPNLKWAAQQIGRTLATLSAEDPQLGAALLAIQMDGHEDQNLPAIAPDRASGPILDDVIGKKVLLRDGTGADAFYFLLNYRDEGDWGVLHRDFLRQTLAVAEEKMHHGNSDENSIVLWMHEGSVLLHDAGYRDQAPSGPYGAYRADIFHNRLVARRGIPADDQPSLEFLRDAGTYRPVRTEGVDFTAFETVDYSRTRLTDRERGYTWDRTLVRDKHLPVVVVIDTVRIDEPGDWTFATLFSTQEIVSLDAGLAVGRTRSIKGMALPGTRDLLLLYPGEDGVPEQAPLMRHSQQENVLIARQSGTFATGTSVAFVTVLRSIAAGLDPAGLRSDVRLVPTDPSTGAVCVEMTSGSGPSRESLTVLLKQDLHLGLSASNVRPRYAGDEGAIQAGSLRTDADILIVRRTPHELRWCATNMTRVDIDGEPAFLAKPLQLFQVTGRSDVVGRTKWRRWEETIDRK